MIMAQLNVFELTNSELSKSLKESKSSKKKNRKSRRMTESAKRFGRAIRRTKSIAANKLRLESLRFVEEADENDDIIDYTPNDDVLLVIDPEMDETPETEEEAEAAAEELVGDYVCKCSICGANYICDCEDVNEDLESEEAECPICGETGEQIIVGEIAPADDVADDDESDDDEDDEDIDDDDSDVADDDIDDDSDIDTDEDTSDEDEDEDEDFGESISRAKRRTALRRESASRARKNRLSAKRLRRESANRNSRKANGRGVAYNLDEVALNRMLTKFAKENYDNVRLVKINNAKCKGSRLTLEGVVVTTKGTKRSTKFVCENFKPVARSQANFKEIGAFTENATSSRNAFTINFVTKNKTITPTSLKYNFNVKEGRAHYNVSGNVMNESAKRKRR